MGVQFAGNILVQSNGGPLPISQGGTGQTTAPTAINALIPTQAGQSGKYLTTNGTNVSWTSSAGGTPGGSDTQIQYNDSGTFGGSANLVIDKSTGAVTSLSTLTNIGLLITGLSTANRPIKLQTSDSDRWILQANNVSETGSNVGSNFEFIRVADNGLTQNQVLTIARATGIVDFKTTPTINGLAIGTVTSIVAGTSVSVSGSTGAVTINNTGVTSNVAGTGISVSGSTGAVTITNSGVTSAVAGTNISVSGSTGAVTFSVTGTVANATSATKATNIAGGLVGYIPYQSSVDTTALLAPGTSTYVLTSNGSGAAPSWQAQAASAAGSLTGTTLASTVVNSSLTSVGTLGSLTVTGNITSNGLQVGYLIVPQNATGSATLTLSDSGKHIYTSSGGQAYVIPANSSVAYPIGTAITFVNQSTTSCSIAINSDTMYFAGTAGTTGTRTLGNYGVATALKVASTVWMISGTSLT